MDDSRKDLLGGQHTLQESNLDGLIGDVLDDLGVDGVDDILDTLDDSDNEAAQNTNTNNNNNNNNDDDDNDDDNDYDDNETYNMTGIIHDMDDNKNNNNDNNNNNQQQNNNNNTGNIVNDNEEDDLSIDPADLVDLLDDDEDDGGGGDAGADEPVPSAYTQGDAAVGRQDSDIHTDDEPLITNNNNDNNNYNKRERQKQQIAARTAGDDDDKVKKMQTLAAVGVDSASSLGGLGGSGTADDNNNDKFAIRPSNTAREFNAIIDDLGDDITGHLENPDDIKDSDDDEDNNQAGQQYNTNNNNNQYHDMNDDDDDDEEPSMSSRLQREREMKQSSWEAREEKLQSIDEAVMLLLTPDYFQVTSRSERMEMLMQNHPGIKELDDDTINVSIKQVADAMGIVNHVIMYDTDMKSETEHKEKELYKLREVDLSQVKGIPKKYFEGTGDGNEDSKQSHSGSGGKNKGGGRDRADSDGSAILDEIDTDGIMGGHSSGGRGGMNDDGSDDDMAPDTMEIDVSDLLDDDTGMGGNSDGGIGSGSGGLNKTLKKIGKNKEAESKIVCAGCGLKIKFKSKHRNKDNYVSFYCQKTNKFYVFHDYVCVYLRKIKEAIRMYVFLKEKEENPDDPDIDSNFININVDEHIKANQRMKPRHNTTPKRGDWNYKDENGDNNNDYEESNSSNLLGMGLASAGTLYDAFNPLAAMFQNEQEKEDEHKIKYLKFRKYRMQVDASVKRFNKKNHDEGQTYTDRFGELPKLIIYCDLQEMGIPIWEFIADALKSKQRVSLWMILRFLALEMPTNSVLDLLKRHTHLLSKHMLREYDEVCKSTMEGAKHPIACALRLSAFMYERAQIDLSNSEDYRRVGDQYGMIARKLLQGIESDHLFAMLLQMPTDLEDLCIIEIALKYNLTYFLEDPRIVRVFNVIWFGGFDFLDPKSNFQDAELPLPEVYKKLVFTPGRFYFSPIGKFYTTSVLYLCFLFLFTFVTYNQVYYYDSTSLGWSESIFWPCTLGYILHEVVECMNDPKEYLASTSNYFDIYISVAWFILGYYRFILSSDTDLLVFDSSGQISESETRNTTVTTIYLGIWGLQCVLLWTRLGSLLQTTRSLGPLIRMIINMLSDIGNFGIIAGVFVVGITFAVYYIIGEDLRDTDVKLGGQGLVGFQSIGLFIFRTLIGQPEWSELDSQTGTYDDIYNDSDDTEYEIFSPFRSNLVIAYIGLFSIFGTILLLNLLIAMMAESYETVKNRSKLELNKQRINKTWDLDRTRAVIAPPVNLCAYLINLYFFAFEGIVWLLTFGHRQFNEEYFSPLNKDAKHYRVGDTIKFKRKDEKISATVIKRTNIMNRLQHINDTAQDRRRSTVIPKGGLNGAIAGANGNMVWDLQVKRGRQTYDLLDNHVLKVKKPFFKQRVTRIPTLDIENEYCRFCRFNISNEMMDISYYLHFFEMKGIHIDPEDRNFMIELLDNYDSRYNIPNPKICQLCPNCYRPFFIRRDGSRDVIDRRMFIFEISSYLAFLTIVWPILSILMFFPANVAGIVGFVKKIVLLSLGSDEEDEEQELEAQKKMVSNFVENNDEYRDKVRKNSIQELDINRLVKRIDLKVLSLEREILHNKEDGMEVLDATAHAAKTGLGSGNKENGDNDDDDMDDDDMDEDEDMENKENADAEAEAAAAAAAAAAQAAAAHAEEEIDENLVFRADDYNKKVDRMKKEMHQRFDEMKKLLHEAGIGTDENENNNDDNHIMGY